MTRQIASHRTERITGERRTDRKRAPQLTRIRTHHALGDRHSKHALQLIQVKEEVRTIQEGMVRREEGKTQVKKAIRRTRRITERITGERRVKRKRTAQQTQERTLYALRDQHSCYTLIQIQIGTLRGTIQIGTLRGTIR